MFFACFLVIALINLQEASLLEKLKTKQCRHPPIENLIATYTKEYTRHLTKLTTNLHHIYNSQVENRSNGNHSQITLDNNYIWAAKTACSYYFRVIYRHDKYPYTIKEAVLKKSTNVLPSILKYECQPIQIIQPVLVQDECQSDSYFKFLFKFEIITIGFKFVYY